MTALAALAALTTGVARAGIVREEIGWQRFAGQARKHDGERDGGQGGRPSREREGTQAVRHGCERDGDEALRRVGGGDMAGIVARLPIFGARQN
jgi:hypothetical protein